MKTRNKVLLTLLCAVLLVATTIAGTVAFLTSTKTVTNTFTVGDVEIALDEALVNADGEAVKATWDDKNGNDIVDKDEITITEKTDNLEEAFRVMENDYHLLPNTEHTKDPTVTVKAGSEESYVRMILTVHNASAVQAIIDAEEDTEDIIKDYSDLFGGWHENEWDYQDFSADSDADTISFEFWYKETVDGYEPIDGVEVKTDVKLPALFTSIIVPPYVTNDQLDALEGEDDNPDDDFKMVIKAYAIQAEGFDNAEQAWDSFPADAN